MNTTRKISFIVVFTLVFSLFSITAFADTARTATITDGQNQISITNVKGEDKVDYSDSMGGIGIITLYKVEAGSKMTLKEAAIVDISPAFYHTDNADKAYKGILNDADKPYTDWDGKGSYTFTSGLYIVYFSETIIAVEMDAADTTTAPAAPVVTVPQKATATPTVSKVLVNGVSTAFDAYNINGNNYFKLRDLATAVNATTKQFEVTFDAAKNAIDLKSNSPYTKVGGEMVKSDGKAKNAVLSTSKIYKDGAELKSTAYNIGGNNYFKLRDVAQAFNFSVTFDSTTNTIKIDTNADYVAQ